MYAPIQESTGRLAKAGRSNAARLAAIPQVDNDSGQRQRQTHHHDIRQEKLACTHRQYIRVISTSNSAPDGAMKILHNTP